MKRRTKFLMGIIVVMLVGVLAMGAQQGEVEALSSQSNVGVNFTFDSAISVGVSGDLTIYDLQPGTSAESDVVSVKVATNNLSGYILEATAGDSSYAGGGGNYNANDLVLTNGATPSSTTTDKFTSLATDASAASITTDNTWGYSYKVNTGSWSNYAGLPIYNSGSTKELNSTTTASSDTVRLKIAAKAASTQATGTYTNVVNLYAVANANPISFYDAFAAAGKTQYNGYYKMQDMTSTICQNVDQDQTATLMDIRDGNLYIVTKLKDDKCWMTSNLNLPGGTELYSETSDVPDGYSSTNNIAYYTLPVSATAAADGYTLTDSTQFSSDSGQYVFNSGNNTSTESDCNSTHPCNSYYSWLTATAGGKDSNGASVTGNGYNAAYSICPKNWHLPTATTEGVARDSGGYTGGEFYQMLNLYGLTTGTYYANADTTPLGSTVYNSIKAGTAPNFLRAGHYVSGTFDDSGSYGDYWSSTSFSGSHAYNLYFNSVRVYSANNFNRRSGFSVRCVSDN